MELSQHTAQDLNFETYQQKERVETHALKQDLNIAGDQKGRMLCLKYKGS